MPKEKTAEPEQKTKYVENGLVELNVNVPRLIQENTKLIMRDIRHTLENCGRLNLLDEFVETLRAEYYEEVPILGAE